MPTAAVSSKTSTAVTREVILPKGQVTRLEQLAAMRQISESKIIENALNIFFNLAEILDETVDRSDWQRLSEASLLRLWDNEQDAVYDDWRELYGVSQG
jgi:predicted transcriptional regulator